MSRIHVRNKGRAGEREFANLLQEHLDCGFLDRNLEQSREGGADIVSLIPFAIEVKRVQSLQINAWRKQAMMQTTTRNPIPVLAYRQNHKQWMIQMMCIDLVKKRYVVDKQAWMEVSFDTFIGIARRIIDRMPGS